jgi:hypothetical protein
VLKRNWVLCSWIGELSKKRGKKEKPQCSPAAAGAYMQPGKKKAREREPCAIFA